MRMHVQSAALYGARVNGISNVALEKLRTIVRAATSTRAQGGSASIDLVLQKQRDIDPAFAGNTLPLLQWAFKVKVAARCGDMRILDIHRKAWCAAMANMAMCLQSDDNPWKHIRGPASACIATIGRIGWDVPQMEGWKKWIDRDGRVIDLTVVSPHSLKKLLHRDIAKAYWAKSMLNEKAMDSSGIWLEPLRSAVFISDKEKGAMTRSAAIGIQWTQDRVAEAGYASDKADNKCRLCNQAVGSLKHRFDSDGCPVLQSERTQWLTNRDDDLICDVQPKLLNTHGFLLNSERPSVDWKPAPYVTHWYESDTTTRWGDQTGRRKTFCGDTFVDGSCIPCRENDDLTQCGWSVVTMLSGPSDSRRNRAENPDANEPRCTCRNMYNRYHKCVRECGPLHGCDGKCFSKRSDQHRPRAPVGNALYGVLPGYDQTTPRAELYAIYQAVKHGASPQRIISDHVNHVNALNDWMHHGTTSFLHPKAPNVDLWRKVYDEVNRRGGLHASGSRQLCFAWQPSHTRASDCETEEHKFLQRGNDAADYYANLGRALHVDISQCVMETQTRSKRAKAWACWIGHASFLQYSRLWEGCDHDVKPKGAVANPKNIRQDVKVPCEAKVIRRMPWARSSLGTIEYLDDLWNDDCSPHDEHDCSPHVAHTIRARGTLAEIAYLERFHYNVMGGTQRKGLRFIPRQCTFEMSEALPTSAAMGHHMMTAGLKPCQFSWCELCCSYTGQRVRKLMHDCDRIKRNVPAVDMLRQGCNPYDGSPLLTKPRRLCKRDVGSHSWSGEGWPDDNLHVCGSISTNSDSVSPWDLATCDLAAQHAEGG